MQAERFFSASRLAIVAGKGGVGKTVVAAAWARAAAQSGLDTLFVSLAGRANACASLGIAQLGYAETVVTERLRARAITPDEALTDYLRDHGMARVAHHMATTGVIDMVATATPGVRDLVVLGKIKQLVASDAAQLVVVDAPAAGHAIAFLDSARALHDSARIGPIHQQASEVLAMLRDGRRSQVILVALPEETPVNELIETAFRLEDQVGVALGPIVVNGVLPDIAGIDAPLPDALSPRSLGVLSAVGAHWVARRTQQVAQIERLAGALPLPQLHLPQLFSAGIGTAESSELACALIGEVETLGS